MHECITLHCQCIICIALHCQCTHSLAMYQVHCTALSMHQVYCIALSMHHEQHNALHALRIVMHWVHCVHWYWNMSTTVHCMHCALQCIECIQCIDSETWAALCIACIAHCNALSALFLTMSNPACIQRNSDVWCAFMHSIPFVHWVNLHALQCIDALQDTICIEVHFSTFNWQG